MEALDTPDPSPVLPNRTLNLDALRSFVAIHETGSFRRAAARVNRSPSAVSLQIRTLEEFYGVRFLDRDARHVSLTEHGEVLIGIARRLLGINDEAVTLFRGPALTGRLRLTAPHDLGVSLVPRLLRRMAEAYPGIAVDVRLGTSEAVQQQFLDGSANLALFNDLQPSPVKARVLYSEPLKWLMCTGGSAIARDPLPLAVAEVGCAWRDAAFAGLQAVGRPYHVSYYSDTSMGQVAALRADLAVAALPGSLAEGALSEVPHEHGLPPLPASEIRLADDGSEIGKAFVTVALKEALHT